MENNYWYVGQKVSDQRFGNGEIININTTAFCPILVDFNGRKEAYYIDGKYRDEDAFSSLSQNPHVPLKHKKMFKKGDVVWYKLNENKWLGIYDCFEEGSHKIIYSQGIVNRYEYINDKNIELYSPNVIKE